MSLLSYEQRLSGNARRALSEGSKFFEDKSAVQDALRKITRRLDGVRCINLPALVTLKIASGMTIPARLKDLADVQELVKRLHLSREFGAELHAYVQEKYGELWDAAQGAPADE